MATDSGAARQESSYALGLANGSYDWYRQAAIHARQRHRISAIGSQVAAAAIPVSAVIAPHNATVPAILGAVIVVVTSLRSTFNWQENYLRFNGAREAVEAERRRYHTTSAPYGDPTSRDQILAAMISKIEQEEMAGWVKVVSERTQTGHI
ncbi:hypothetical protein Caci_0494 [Catenulispora acidiphila DSM 44928]|uniref:SMODS and SLOG-associating 2TM effector domain-containing protein n=1 Tax=Catenulispora acidiphila (strain DSM 44928 / JCM 14897 / NBRC 102108 / NRRL B-24433 / ID139908) TaxID=479433 RepID=C7PX93_CATAD|nr:DUF4231 domain-containing protein [Catenulispora acidiphila]ACU69444.1 hypothetical protein Caci_0494 [Catenulispora acidiphila DSM 44928]